MIRRQEQVEAQAFEQCHEGVGTLLCRSMLMDGDSQYGVMFFHHDPYPSRGFNWGTPSSGKRRNLLSSFRQLHLVV